MNIDGKQGRSSAARNGLSTTLRGSDGRKRKTSYERLGLGGAAVRPVWARGRCLPLRSFVEMRRMNLPQMNATHLRWRNKSLHRHSAIGQRLAGGCAKALLS